MDYRKLCQQFIQAWGCLDNNDALVFNVSQSVKNSATCYDYTRIMQESKRSATQNTINEFVHKTNT